MSVGPVRTLTVFHWMGLGGGDGSGEGKFPSHLSFVCCLLIASEEEVRGRASPHASELQTQRTYLKCESVVWCLRSSINHQGTNCS